MGVDPTVSQREIGSATQKSKGTGGLVSIVSYSRPSRGLLRDYEPSDLLRMELFEALDPGVQRGHQGPGAGAQHLQRPARPLHHPPQAAAAHGRGVGGLQLGLL